MVFKMRPGYYIGVSAQVAGERLEEIREANDGVITPKAVVDDARPADADLHPCFEWNNRKAAEAHREDQARQIIRAIEIIKDEDPEIDEPKRQIAYVSIASYQGGQPGYRATEEAMADENMAYCVIEAAKAQLRGWHRRYGELRELAPIAEAIEEFLNVAV